MRLIPRAPLAIESPRSVAEVSAALRAAVLEKRRGFPPPWAEPGRLTGTVEGTRVKVRRRLGLLVRNAWEPVFDGCVEPTRRGSRLAGVLRMSRPVELFTAAWLGVAGLALVVTLLGAALGAPNSGAGVALTGAMFGAGALLALGSFWGSVSRLRETLEERVRGG